MVASLLKSIRFVCGRGKFWFIASVFLTIILGILPVISVWVSKELINNVASLIHDPLESYWAPLLWLFLQFSITLITSLLNNAQDYMNRSLGIRLDHDLQQIISNKTTSVPLGFYDLPEFYNDINRISSNKGGRFTSPIQILLNIIKGMISLVSFIAYLSTVHWLLVVLSLLAAAPIFLVQSKFGKRKYSLFYNQTSKTRELRYTAYLLQDRQAAKEIRLFGLADFLADRWSLLFKETSKHDLRLLRKQQISGVGLDLISALFYMCSAGIIVWLIRKSSLLVGDYVAICQAVQGSQKSINQISTSMARLQEESLYLNDFFKFIEFEDKRIVQSSGNIDFPSPLCIGISLQNISFRYTGSANYTLRNISFHIKPGERIALVGDNGSGKSTLVKCLLGLYPVTEGGIFFDGISIQQFNKSDFHQNMTVIFQDFMKYSYSAYDNIVFGDISNKDDQVRLETAASKSGVEEFVENFENGYDTYLGRFLYNGEDLSGGQWQKIALARALFRNGEVFILDEPTAALDPLAEMEIFEQFNNITIGKTAIFISHRMSAARMADRILVMKNGEIIESGTHDELIELKKEYFQMYTSQAQWYV